MTAQHSELSGSGAYRWIRCPGSIALSKAAGRGGSSAAGREGTMAHAVSHHILATGKKPKTTKPFVFMDHEDEITDMTPTSEMIEYIMIYVDHIREHGKTGDVHLEQHLSLERLVKKGMFGTADAIVDKKGTRTLVVCDFKYGFTPVHISEDDPDDLLLGLKPNEQLMYYAAGALDMFDWRHDQVILEIVQPRCMEVEPVQSILISAAYVRWWAENTLWQAAHAATTENATLVPGDHCRFCLALNICPAARQKVQSLAVQDFGELVADIPVPDDGDHLAEVLRWSGLIDAWLRSCEEAALAELQNGRTIPGFKLVKKRANRVWPTDVPKKLADMLNDHLPKGKMFRSTDRLMQDPKLKSPAQLEEIIDRDVIDQVAIRPDNGVTLARESDKRRAIEPVNDFEKLT